jgi:hypothetical protein
VVRWSRRCLVVAFRGDASRCEGAALALVFVTALPVSLVASSHAPAVEEVDCPERDAEQEREQGNRRDNRQGEERDDRGDVEEDEDGVVAASIADPRRFIS